jgi:hypothetical protein
VALLKHEVRKQQWEIGELLAAYLKDGKVLTGNIHEIIAVSGIHGNCRAVAKYLQRAETMPSIPFLVRRTHISDVSFPRCVYRIRLKRDG